MVSPGKTEPPVSCPFVLGRRRLLGCRVKLKNIYSFSLTGTWWVPPVVCVDNGVDWFFFFGVFPSGFRMFLNARVFQRSKSCGDFRVYRGEFEWIRVTDLRFLMCSLFWSSAEHFYRKTVVNLAFYPVKVGTCLVGSSVSVRSMDKTWQVSIQFDLLVPWTEKSYVNRSRWFCSLLLV